MSDPRVKIDIIATGSTVLTDAERQRALNAMTALPGMAYEIHPANDSRTVEGLIETIRTCGKAMQGLHDEIARLENTAAVTARDVLGLRRILGVR